MRYARVFLGGPVVAFALAQPSQSWGQTVDSVAIADGLFKEAQQLIRENRVSEACVKFEESDRIDPGLGTKLSLADCYEREGKLVAAWITFMAIIPAARQANRADREVFAKGRAEALGPRVPKLLITLSVADATSAEVLRDGVVVGAAALVLPLPVEAGKHVIVVRSAGFSDWSTEVVAEEGKTLEVKVPALEAKVVDVPRPLPVVVPLPLPNAPSGVRTGGFITLGLGGAGLLTWAVAGSVAMSKKSLVDENCPTEPCANLGASNAAREAFGAGKTAASVATAGLVVGVVGLVTGGVMVLSGGSRRPPGQPKSGVQAMLLDVSLSGGMFGVQGVFR